MATTGISAGIPGCASEITRKEARRGRLLRNIVSGANITPGSSTRLTSTGYVSLPLVSSTIVTTGNGTINFTPAWTRRTLIHLRRRNHPHEDRPAPGRYQCRLCFLRYTKTPRQEFIARPGKRAHFTFTRNKFGTKAAIASVARMQARPPLTTDNSG